MTHHEEKIFFITACSSFLLLDNTVYSVHEHKAALNTLQQFFKNYSGRD